MTREDPYDVVVVGGGPAGSACATWLAQEGFRVLILDRARFPRDKPCGEFLTPGAAECLRQLGAWDAVARSDASSVAGIRLLAPSGLCAAYSPESGQPAGWSIRRTLLDNVMLQHARASGAEVLEGATLRSLQYDKGVGRWALGVDGPPAPIGEQLEPARSWDSHSSVSERRIGTGIRGQPQASSSAPPGVGGPISPAPLLPRSPAVIHARLLIGADGANSFVARQLGLVRRIPGLQRIGLVSHWCGVEGDSLEMRSSGGVVCGFGPLANGEANITLVVPRSEAQRMAGRQAAYVSEIIGFRFPDLAEKLAGGMPDSVVRTVACFGHTCKRASAHGALLVGDAATFVDPFTGEGIYFALRGAELAADVASRSLRGGDVSARSLGQYDLARTEIVRRYLLCYVVQAVVRSGWAMGRATAGLAYSLDTLQTLMEALGDIASPEQVLRPGFACDLWHASLGLA